MVALLILMLAAANGVNVPALCWLFWAVWAAMKILLSVDAFAKKGEDAK